jgi:hypothetical protein
MCFEPNVAQNQTKINETLTKLMKKFQESVGKISNLPEDLIHEKSEEKMIVNMEIKQTTFTRERYEQSISKSIASPRN